MSEIRNNNSQEAILSGPVTPTLVRFAIPILCGNLFQQLYNLVDALVVGRLLGDLSLAGISAAAPIMDLLYGLLVGACTGIAVLTGRLCGAGEHERLRRVHATALLGGGGIALLLSAVTLCAAGPVLLGEGFDTETTAEALRYLGIIGAGLPVNFLYNYYAALLRSYGNSRIPFLVLAVSSLAHAGLDFLFIGVFGFGIRGVACSTVLCQLLSLLCLLWYTQTRCPELALSLRQLRLDRPSAGEVLSYAWSTALQALVVYGGRLLVQSTLTSLGPDTVSGYNLGMKVEGMNQAFYTGIAAGATVCMAQNCGGRKPERVRLFFYRGYALEMLCALLVGTVLFCFPGRIIGLFTDSAAVTRAGAAYTGTMAFVYFCAYSGEMIQSYYRGVGKLYVTAIASGAQVCLRVILSFLLVPRLGIYGICIATGTGWFLMSLIEGPLALRDARRLTENTGSAEKLLDSDVT